MKRSIASILVTLLFTSSLATAQINFTANDIVNPYDDHFLYGINGGWYGHSWDDESLADIAAGNPAKNVKGVGVRSMRPPLSEEFLENWGYDIRVRELNYSASLGMQHHTVILDKPVWSHKDQTRYNGCSEESKLFRNLYSPIWDNGANGTPVNDSNFYALYVYKIVNKYKSFTKFWEVINEPDFDASGNGWKRRGQPGNWWDNNPQPCELTNMKAPVFHYVRMLRISFEVIKYLDPTAYVATGGLGYASFLDAVLRSTDNPVDGSVSQEYPLRGGAYFDVLSFHSYPMYNLAKWSNQINGWVYERHSDAAADQLIAAKNEMDSVLTTYGYNGATFPSKIFICTENNIPRRSINTYIGGDEVQKNYILKSLVLCQKHRIRQLYMYMLGDTKADHESTSDLYEYMGLYKKLEAIGPLQNGGVYQHQFNDGGIAFKTCSELLYGYKYDSERTEAMLLPAGVEGGAFVNAMGQWIYVLWARTSVDMAESSGATYSFPVNFNLYPLISRKEWNYSVTGTTTQIATSNIALTGSPIFLTAEAQVLSLDEKPERERSRPLGDLRIYPNPLTASSVLAIDLQKAATLQVQIFNIEGKVVWRRGSQRYSRGKHILNVGALASLSQGIYYYRVIGEMEQWSGQVVVGR